MENNKKDSPGCLILVAVIFGIAVLSVAFGLIFQGSDFLEGEGQVSIGALRFWFVLTIIIGIIYLYRNYSKKE